MPQNKTEKEKVLTKPLVVCLVASFCCLLWGSAFPALKIGCAMMNISPDKPASEMLFAGIRFAAAGAVVIGCTSVKKKKFVRPTEKSLPAVLIISLFQTVLQYFFYYIGLSHTTGVKAAVLVGSNVFAALITSCLIFKLEKITVRKIIGCLLGLIGVMLVNFDGKGLDFRFTVLGEGFVLLSSLAYAFSSVFMKKYSAKYDTSMMSGWQFFLGGLVMAAGGLLFGGRIEPQSASAFVMLMYLAALSAAAYTLWAMLLEYNSVTQVAIYGFINPVCGVLLSAIFLGETTQAFRIQSLAALVLVCVGIFIVNHINIKEKQTN